MTSELVNFPRGGRSSHNEDIQSDTNEDKDLFEDFGEGSEERNVKALHKGQKRSAEAERIGEKKQKTGNVVLKSDGHIGYLQFQDINAGMVILACVQDVTEYTIKCALPGGLHGMVPITAISDAYKKQLESVVYSNDLSSVSQNVSGLKELFQQGMVLPCQVTDIVKYGAKEITLSINPKQVNHGVSSKNLQKDIVVFGCISSCEDHGYMVDLGVKGSCTFLGNDEAKTFIKVFTNGRIHTMAFDEQVVEHWFEQKMAQTADSHPRNQLSIGQSVWCRILVSEASKSSENRTVQVTVDPKKIKEGKVESSSGLVMTNLVPGMKVTASVKEIKEEGLLVSFLSYTGTIHKTHLPENAQTYHRKDKIFACILYINMTTKIISLSALPSLVEYSGIPLKKQFSGLSIGDVVKAEISYRVKNIGLFFKLPHKNKGFASMNQLGDDFVNLMKEDFKPGSKHRVRVVNFNRIDSIVLVSLKESVISQKFMQVSDIKPGWLIECTVRGIHDGGVSVHVTDYIRAFIPTIHLADVPLKNPTKQFCVGKKLKCRALVVKDNKLTLTNKKSLVRTKLPIITSYEDVQPNMELDGVIVKITESGVLVLFFNEVKGWAMRYNLCDEEDVNLNEMFYIGQMIRCWVLRCDPDEHKIQLSFKFDDAKSKRNKEHVPKIGEIVSCLIGEKHSQGFDVKVLPSNQPGFLSKIHLDDELTECDAEFEKIHVGDVIDNLVLFKELNVHILTKKKSILKAVKDGKIIQRFKDLEVDQEHVAVVRNITSYGVFVELVGEIIGLVLNVHTHTQRGSDLSQLYEHGQTVKVKILDIDTEKNRFLGTFLLQIEKCQVVSKTDKGVKVTVISSGDSGFIPMMHLSDSEDLCTLLLSQLSKGDILDEVMCFNSNPDNIFTMKKTQLNAAEKIFSSLKVNQVRAGVVKNHVKFGMFVQFAGGLTGLVPSSQISNTKADDYSNVFKQGQSVMFKVTSVDEKKVFSGSVKLRDCYSGDVNVSLDLLKQYLAERTKRFDSVDSEIGKKLVSHKIGSIVKVTITDITKKGVICRLDDGVPGYVTNDHLRGITARVGDKLEAIVLDVTLIDNCVELLFDKLVIREMKRLKDKPQSKALPKQIIKAEVLLVRQDFVLMELKKHAVGRLAYIPAKKHLNDVFGPRYFSTDELIKVVIKGEVDNIPIGVVEAWYRDKSQSKLTVTPGKSKKKNKQDVDHGMDDTAEDEDDMDDDDDTDDDNDDTDDENSNDEDSSDKEVLFKCPYKIGELVEAKITKIQKFHMNVNVKGVAGRVHITEVTDKLEDGFSPLIHYSKDTPVAVKIIGTFSKQPGRYMPITGSRHKTEIAECSMKSSNLVVKKKKRKRLSKKKQEYNVGDSVIAFVKEFSNHTLWMMVSPTVNGRVHELNVSENLSVLRKLELHFKPGQGYNATIIGIDKEGLLELSLTGDKEIPTENCVTRGRVLDVKDCFLVIQLACGYRGTVNITDVLDSFRSFPFCHHNPGDFVKCFVLNIDPDCKTKCVLSLRKSRISATKANIKDAEYADKSELEKGQVLRGFVKALHSNHILVQLGRSIVAHADNKKSLGCSANAGEMVSVKILRLKGDTIKVSFKTDTATPSKRKSEIPADEENYKRQKTSVDSDSGVDFIKDSDSDSELPVLPKPSELEKAPRLTVSSGFCWDEEFSIPKSATDHSGSDEESDDEHQTPARRKKLKNLTQKEEEEMILEYERRQQEGDLMPQTADDFDRLVLQSPDSSLVWLRYMAFQLESTEIEKARDIAERALKTISFREEQEKLNVWVAFLNLENLYGTPETLKKVFDRATQYNEPLKVYQQLIGVYVNSGKVEEAERLYNTMIRRFSLYKEVWLGYCLFFFKNSRLDSARKLLQRSLKSLDKREHVEMISKFAQMEFKHGESERGCTMFESILSNYPKRTDLWSVFIDMVVKTGDISAARQLFERVVNIKFSARKMKFFFKKYVEFEKKHGDNTTVEQVKQKALDYVETQG